MNHALTIIRAMLLAPGRHLARLSALDPQWIETPAERLLFQALRKRPMTREQALAWLRECPLKPRAVRALQGILEAIETDPVQDGELDHAAQTLADRACRLHLLDRTRSVLEALDAQDISKASKLASGMAEEVSWFQVSTGAPLDAMDVMAALNTETRAPRRFFKTGLKKLDDATDGVMPHELWLVAGAPSEGKTTLSLNIAWNALMQGQRVLWVPLENPVEQVTGFLAARHSAHLSPEKPLNTRHLRTGVLDDHARALFARVTDDLQRIKRETGASVDVWAPGRGATIKSVQAAVDAACWTRPYDLLVVDYLEQLAPVRDRRDGRAELNDTLARAKELAQTYASNRGIAVMSPHQVNRNARAECEKRKPSPHYRLWDLAETAKAEREADTVIWSLQTDRLARSRQVLIGSAKARGATKIRLGFRAMEDFSCCLLGNIGDDDQDGVEVADPEDDDFEGVE